MNELTFVKNGFDLWIGKVCGSSFIGSSLIFFGIPERLLFIDYILQKKLIFCGAMAVNLIRKLAKIHKNHLKFKARSQKIN